MKSLIDLRQAWSLANRYHLFNILRLSNWSPALLGVIICLTNRCNMKCYMCDVGRKIDSGERYDHEEFNLELLKRTIDECAAFKFIRPRIHFSGAGEPLIYKNFPEAASYCRDKKISWSLTTNGYALDGRYKDIVDAKCDHITISVHGLDEMHDSIVRVKGCFERVISNIKLLDSYKKTRKAAHPIIALHCVISRKNVNDLKKIFDFFEPFPMHSIEFIHMMFGQDDLGDPERGIPNGEEDADSINELCRYVNKRGLNSRVLFLPYLKPEDTYRYYADFNYPFGNACIQPWVSLFVSQDGSVSICPKDVKVGSVRDASVKKIFNNKDSMLFRANLRKVGLTKNCQRCCFRQYY